MGELIDEEHPLVGFVDDAGNDPFVGQRPELGMAAVRVVPNIPEELRFGRAGGHQERVPVEPDEDLARALVLEGTPALERPLVEDLDLLARPLVRDDLLDAGAQTGRPDGLLRVSSGAHRELEDPPHEVAERVAAARDARRHLFHVPAARAVSLGRRGVEAAPRAPVAEAFGDRRWGVGREDQLALDGPGRLPLPVYLFPRDDLDAGALGVLRVVDDPELGPRALQVEREGLRRHRFPDAGGADEQEVAPLVRRDPGDLDRLLLADDPFEGVGRDVDVLGGRDLVQGRRSAVSTLVCRSRHGREGKCSGG